jgi:hypothetical protein
MRLNGIRPANPSVLHVLLASGAREVAQPSRALQECLIFEASPQVPEACGLVAPRYQSAVGKTRYSFGTFGEREFC